MVPFAFCGTHGLISLISMQPYLKSYCPFVCQHLDKRLALLHPELSFKWQADPTAGADTLSGLLDL